MKQLWFRNIAAIRGFFLLSILAFIPALAAANVDAAQTNITSLEQVEPYIQNGPEALATAAAADRDEALKILAGQRIGPKYFGGVTYGHNNEPQFETSQDKYKYNQLNITGGLHFPLLGTLQKEQIGKTEAEIASLKSKHELDMLMVNQLTAVRNAYATLWIERQKEEIAGHFLKTEVEAAATLQERQTRGLILPADTLEFLAVYQDVRRDLAASKMRQMQAVHDIELATGRQWETNGKLSAPSLPSLAGQSIRTTGHPEVAFQSELVKQYEKLFQAKQRMDRDANLTVGVTAARDFPGATGNSAYISLSLTEPFKAIGLADESKMAAASELNQIKQQQTITRLKLDGQAQEALAATTYAAADVNARTAHLIVMAEAIREKQLRHTVLSGDTFEQLLHSKAQYYRAVLDLLDREEVFLKSMITVNSYAYPLGLVSEPTERVMPIKDNDANRTRLVNPDWLGSSKKAHDSNIPFDFSSLPNITAPIVSNWQIELVPAKVNANKPLLPVDTLKAAVYVWDARSFLVSHTRSAALEQVASAGFTRMLLSLTPEQISHVSTPKGKTELQTLLAEAKAKGVRVDLLLGDPAWAEAEHRGELVTMIKQLQLFAFEGIHLDIEPDSLPNAQNRRAELLEGLAATIREVKKIATLPVSISVHPRYLEGELGVVAKQKLLPQGLEEVVVMVYADDSKSVVERMSSIMKANPDVAISLAQSVERDIPAAESYANKSPAEFEAAMELLANELSISGLKGIYIQAWEDYKKGAVR